MPPYINRVRDLGRAWRIQWSLYCSDTCDLIRRLCWITTLKQDRRASWSLADRLLSRQILPIQIVWWGSHGGKVLCQFLGEIVNPEEVQTDTDQCRESILHLSDAIFLAKPLVPSSWSPNTLTELNSRMPSIRTSTTF